MRLPLYTIFLLSLLLILPAKAIEPGAVPPAITLPDGRTLDSLKGKVIYIDFWASWCAPCGASIPWISTLPAKFPKESFSVVTVNLDKSKEDAAVMTGMLSADIISVSDPEGEIARKYDLPTMPTSYLVGKDGKVSMVHRGFRESDKEQLEQSIKEAIEATR